MTEFVFATGSTVVSFPQNVKVQIPVLARSGNPDLIVGGRFVASQAGVWKFTTMTATRGTNMLSRLLDDTSAALALCAINPSGQFTTGWSVLTLAQGDAVWLGAEQGGATTPTPLTANESSAYNRLIVEFMG